MAARKKSLLIGINYTGSQNELHGCHQDVENVAEFLSDRGYSNDPRSQIILRDDMQGPYYPSGHNILVKTVYMPSS
jgi:metacaspase-1